MFISDSILREKVRSHLCYFVFCASTGDMISAHRQMMAIVKLGFDMRTVSDACDAMLKACETVGVTQPIELSGE